MAFQPRKKHRPIRSCLSCRSRRVKCDQIHPVCGNCARAGCLCVYSSPSHEASRARVLDGAPLQSSNEGPALQHEDQTRNEEMGHLHRSLGGRTQYIGPSFWGISSKDGPEMAHFLDDHAGEGPDPLSACEGCSMSRYWDNSEISVMGILQKELPKYERTHTLGQVLDILPPREVCEELWAGFMTTVYPLIPILHLPSFYHQVDEFWESVQRYHEQGTPGGFLAECPSFLALMLSTLFCGSLYGKSSQSNSGSPGDREAATGVRLSRKLYKATIQTLTILGFPRDPTIFSLAAWVIWHVPLIREESERSTSFISTAFRVGQALGLHRDPKHFDIIGSEAEMRRRVWWHILHKDTLNSTASGLPQMLWNQRQHDTAMISELRDDVPMASRDGLAIPCTSSASTLAQGAPECSPIRSQSGCADSRALDDTKADCRQVVAVGRFLITNVIRDILGRQTDLEPWSIQEVQHFQHLIEQMTIQVRGRIDKLRVSDGRESQDEIIDPRYNDRQTTVSIRQASVQSWGLQPTTQNQVFLTWSKKLLSLMIEKAHCTLYQPLQKYSDSTLWHHFREIALSHFHSYVEQYVDLCTEPCYAPFQWIYPGNYQPLQALSVLLTDVVENPTSNEAETSRRLIDSIFSLLGQEGGVVAEHHGHLQQRRLSISGKEVWAMLWQLRRRTWRSIGMDPSILWSCARKHDHEAHDSSSVSESDSDDAESAVDGRDQSVRPEVTGVETGQRPMSMHGQPVDGFSYSTLEDDFGLDAGLGNVTNAFADLEWGQSQR